MRGEANTSAVIAIVERIVALSGSFERRADMKKKG
jgi:hypothetical protein